MSFTTRQAFLEALKADYKAAIETPRSLPTAYPNLPFSPPTTAHAYFNVVWGASEQSEIGGVTNFTRHVGVLFVNVFTPVHQGDTAAMGHAEAIDAHYRHVDLVDARFFTPQVGQGSVQNGWWVQTVQCPFDADQAA